LRRARQFGTVQGVSSQDFARAIESAGSPIVTSFTIYKQANGSLKEAGNHVVVVTGVYRTPEGKVYYSVMGSNLRNRPNYITYIENSNFEALMPFHGGFIVARNGNQAANAQASGSH
jgi:hypothetical protein